jgi:PTS system ascorbate-specific IIA component
MRGMKMKDLLKLENVFIRNSVESWQEAIKVSIKPLVEQGFCEERYIKGVFENTEKFGPYYVLCENLALIHASSDQGALKTQLSITLLKEPIKFKKGGLDVRVLVVLVATDSESHLSAMQAVSRIFTDDTLVQQLLDATSSKTVYDIFVLD